MKKCLLSAILLIALLLGLTAAAGAANVTGINTAGKTAIFVGDTVKWTASSVPSGASLYWGAGNPGVATVDQNGNITAHKPGKCNISITAPDGFQKVLTVTVTDRAYTAIKTAGVTTLKIGEAVQWTAETVPAGGKITWAAGYPAVATVNQNGIITAHKPGVCDISMTAGKLKKTIRLTVTSERRYGYSSTSSTLSSNWARVSPIQQFQYKSQGLGYASLEGGTLRIVLPGKILNIPADHSLLGDVVADNSGNLYVVWGDENLTEDTEKESLFLTKYTANGQRLWSIGHPSSNTWENSGLCREKIPFDAGNCRTVLADGKAVIVCSKEMFSGHQANLCFVVDLSGSAPAVLSEKDATSWKWCSHCFDQRVLWSEKYKAFIFAEHGDAYDRGFNISSPWVHATVFHFYLQPKANHDMYIVNKTFARMGGLCEVSRGVVLAGASVKSIGENAKNERRNLFVQIMNPTVDVSDPSMFIGGVTRSGETCEDNKDTGYAPMTPVSDRGVHWLTNYTDRDVCDVQMAVVKDQIVLLWNELSDSYSLDTFYMVLAADGTVVKPCTALGKLPLNAYEDPVVVQGKLCWAALSNGDLRYCTLDPETGKVTQ